MVGTKAIKRSDASWSKLQRAKRVRAARLERDWYEAELKRGALAFAPDELCCYECNGFDGRTWKVQTVVADAGVSGGSDPWQLYRLACGHTVMGCEHGGNCKDRPADPDVVLTGVPCQWPGHADAMEEVGWCSVCQ